MLNCSLYHKSTRDDPRLPFLGSTSIPRSQLYKTGGLSNFRHLQRFPEKPVSNLQEKQFQHRNLRKAPWMPYHLEKRADSQDSIEEIAQHSTSTSREPFPQQQLCERDPEFAGLSRVPWLKRRSDFPAVAWMHACFSSHKMKRCINPLWRP